MVEAFAAPDRVRAVATRWGLTVVERLTGGTSAAVYGAQDEVGHEFVLKLPAGRADAKSVTSDEAAALTTWRDSGVSPRLIRFDSEALLQLRSRPGTLMPAIGWDNLAELVAVAATVLTRLWSAEPMSYRFPSQADFYRYAERTARADAAFEQHRRDEPDRGLIGVLLLPIAARAAESLAASAPTTTLLHGDFITKNLIQDDLSPYGYRAIDPLPHLGDPAAEVAAFAVYQPAEMIMPSAEALAVRLGLDPNRALRWTVVWLIHQVTQAWRADQAELERLVRAPSVIRLLV